MQIPTELFHKIKEYMSDEKTGELVIDFRQGQIMSYKATEYRRIATELQPRILERKATE
jgi:hypothetical protein